MREFAERVDPHVRDCTSLAVPVFDHLHIVACSPRSGTTLLHEAMVTCFRIDKHYEHEIRFNQVTAAEGCIVLTKRPKDTFYIEELLARDQRFHAIYLLRDPRDVIVSRHGKASDLYYSNIRLWRELQAAAKPVAGHPRFLQIRYEDFVTRPDAVQRAITERFPWLESLHSFSSYHQHAQVSAKSQTAMHGVRPIAPTSVGRWRDNLPRVKGQQEIHGSLTPDLIDSGYESSGDWEAVLDGVKADLSASRYPEKVYWPRRVLRELDAKRKIRAYLAVRRSGERD